MDRLASITAFVRVTENGGFSAAARSLNVSTTTISSFTTTQLAAFSSTQLGYFTATQFQALTTNQGVLVGSYASVARMLDELATVPGVQGVFATGDVARASLQFPLST